jgi:hypothetical protein
MTNGRPSTRVIVSLPFFLMEHLRPLELVLFRQQGFARFSEPV